MTTQTFDVRVYKSGNSKVFTIPSKAPIKVGDVFEVTVLDKELSLKRKKTPLRVQSRLDDLNKWLHKNASPGISKGMNAKELDDYLEGIYE